MPVQYVLPAAREMCHRETLRYAFTYLGVFVSCASLEQSKELTARSGSRSMNCTGVTDGGNYTNT